MSEPWILGYCSTHNGAVCLLKGDEIVAAVQEERLTGIKRARLGRLDQSLAFRYCLKAAGIEAVRWRTNRTADSRRGASNVAP